MESVFRGRTDFVIATSDEQNRKNREIQYVADALLLISLRLGHRLELYIQHRRVPTGFLLLQACNQSDVSSPQKFGLRPEESRKLRDPRALTESAGDLAYMRRIPCVLFMYIL